jgi:hypothetical protein
MSSFGEVFELWNGMTPANMTIWYGFQRMEELGWSASAMKNARRSFRRSRRSGTDAILMIGRDDIVLDHARAYWHEAGHVLVARRLEVPVTGVIYTNLKRLPDTRVSGNLQTVYYMTRETNPERKAAEEAD